MSKQYCVYVLSNASRTLYVGVTGNLERRLYEHRHKIIAGFTSRYNITRLVHYEFTEDVQAALAREKQLKGWTRARKIALIEESNPEWEDLSAAWFTDE